MIDNVNHPAHYESGKFECIDVMIETQGVEATKNFCICNAFKYLYRHRRKNGVEDIKKARWYLDKYIELAEDKEEVRNGKWEQENDIFTCSECGYQFECEGYTQFFNYCPNCGAKMDKDGD